MRNKIVYRTITCDPPWSFSDKLPGNTRGAEKNYRTMSVDEICRYPLPPVADDALLFLWRMSAMPEEALAVCRAWGFVPKSEIVWVKTARSAKPVLAFGMGRYVRNCHETCIVAGRGKSASIVLSHSVRSVFMAPLRRHSQKPEEFFRIAEQLGPGPRAELFARAKRPGWTAWGDELGASSPATSSGESFFSTWEKVIKGERDEETDGFSGT